MSEAERKALRDILTKLKKKTIRSSKRFEESANEISEMFTDMIKNIASRLDEAKEKGENAGEVEFHESLERIFKSIRTNIWTLLSDYRNAIEDKDLYVESLETYCKELDATLWSAIDKARKDMEKQIKQEESEKTKKRYVA